MATIPFSLPEHYIDQFIRNPEDKKEEIRLVFHNGKLLVDPITGKLFQGEGSVKRSLYLGTFQDRHLIADEAVGPIPATLEVDLRSLYGQLDDALFGLAGRAMQLLGWEQTHQFCGQCGSKTRDREFERAKECPSCNLVAYPKISPVIMALIQKEEKILLAKGANGPQSFYSALAGFVNSGESLENCVRREIREEVGLEVDEIRYFGSQAWPYPHGLIVAFTCKWKKGEIVIDPSEISDAGWFSKDRLPPLPPDYSLSKIIIDHAIK